MEIELESTKAQVERQIKSMADPAYANHLLLREDGKAWLCERANSIKYSFRVIFCPKYVFLCGDISPQILYCRNADSLQWLLSSIDDMEQLFANSQIKQEVFYVKDAIETCHREISSAEEEERMDDMRNWVSLSTKFRHSLTQGEDPRESWLCSSHDVFHQPKINVGVGYGADILWQWYALSTFARLYNKKQAEIPVSRL